MHSVLAKFKEDGKHVLQRCFNRGKTIPYNRCSSKTEKGNIIPRKYHPIQCLT